MQYYSAFTEELPKILRGQMQNVGNIHPLSLQNGSTITKCKDYKKNLKHKRMQYSSKIS